MKEIQGKIKFGVIGIPKETTWVIIEKINFGIKLLKDFLNTDFIFRYGYSSGEYYDPNKFYCLQGQHNPIIISRLSEITEKQAAEFVEKIYHSKGNILGYKDYFKNPTQLFGKPKESLISLLKSNDLWIKEWCNLESFTREHQVVTKGGGILAAIKTKENAPDDFLLIKL